jgi:hypothetical protein
MGHYMPPPGFHGGYYPQQFHQAPGMMHGQPMYNMQSAMPGYNDYRLGSHNFNNSQSALETVSSCGSVISDSVNYNQRDTSSLLKSPSKVKKGFRKVKSTNEKSLPIDPAARDLIMACDSESNIMDKLELLKGKLDLLIYNQSGSRFLQKFLTKANKEIIEFFLNEIDPTLNKLMMDKYGNYFCQELLHSCSGYQRLHILEKVEENFINICKDK